jgi:hypothetical protein
MGRPSAGHDSLSPVTPDPINFFLKKSSYIIKQAPRMEYASNERHKVKGSSKFCSGNRSK